MAAEDNKEEVSKALHSSNAHGSKTEQSSDSETAEEVVKQYKVVILGDGTVGKTSLCSRFCEDMFAKQYKQTVGLDFFVKKVEIQGQCYSLLLCVVADMIGWRL